MDLNERFRTVLEDEPPLGFDPDQLVDGLRRDERRKRVVLAAGLLSAVAVVTVGAGVLQKNSAEQPPAGGIDRQDVAPPGPTFEITSFESRFGGTQEVTPDPTVYEVIEQGSPPMASKRVDIESFLIDSYPGDRGVLEIRRGADVLYQVELGQHDNYASQLVDPWSFTPEAPLRVAISCDEAGAPGGTCEAGVTFTGVTIYP